MLLWHTRGIATRWQIIAEYIYKCVIIDNNDDKNVFVKTQREYLYTSSKSLGLEW